MFHVTSAAQASTSRLWCQWGVRWSWGKNTIWERGFCFPGKRFQREACLLARDNGFCPPTSVSVRKAARECTRGGQQGPWLAPMPTAEPIEWNYKKPSCSSTPQLRTQTRTHWRPGNPCGCIPTSACRLKRIWRGMREPSLLADSQASLMLPEHKFSFGTQDAAAKEGQRVELMGDSWCESLSQSVQPNLFISFLTLLSFIPSTSSFSPPSFLSFCFICICLYFSMSRLSSLPPGPAFDSFFPSVMLCFPPGSQQTSGLQTDSTQRQHTETSFLGQQMEEWFGEAEMRFAMAAALLLSQLVSRKPTTSHSVTYQALNTYCAHTHCWQTE